MFFKETLGWSFDIDEVSANVYKVHAADTHGRVFEKTGLDPDLLLAEAKAYAVKVRDNNKKK